MKEMVVTYLKAVVRSEMKCELSVVHIPRMERSNVPSESMYCL